MAGRLQKADITSCILCSGKASALSGGLALDVLDNAQDTSGTSGDSTGLNALETLSPTHNRGVPLLRRPCSNKRLLLEIVRAHKQRLPLLDNGTDKNRR
jgi:hypothetical protein